jgi:hypothetical protein
MRINLKLSIVATGLKHQALAGRVNELLPKHEHLTEHDLTKLITCRMDPTPDQAQAMARVLGKPTYELFVASGTALPTMSQEGDES